MGLLIPVCFACRRGIGKHDRDCVWQPRPAPPEALLQELEAITGQVEPWREECCVDCGVRPWQCPNCWCHKPEKA